MALLIPRSRIWAWVDVIYYPLGIIGVVLLTFAQTEFNVSREIGAINLQSEILLEELTSFPAAQDIVDSPPSFNRYFELLNSVSETEKSCRQRFGISDDCLAYLSFRPFIQSQISLLISEYQSDSEKVAQVCNGFFDSLIQIKNNSNLIVANEMTVFAASLLSQDLPWDNFIATLYISNNFSTLMNRNWVQLLAELKISSPNVYELVKREINLASTYLFAHHYCFRLPPSVSKTAFQDWVKTGEKESDNIEQNRKEAIENVNTILQRKHLAEFVRFRSWPFILAFAFAMKFGKGVAFIRNTPA